MSLQIVLTRAAPARRSRLLLRHLRAMSSGTAADEVILEKNKNAGVITLNRPKALNALNLSMIRTIYPKLQEWNSDPGTSMVIIKAAGGKAFCAGGDIKAVTDAGKVGDSLAVNFFREEYILNHAIGTLKKPYVAFIHGITMGGGVGLSVHGKFRVATEKTLFAMPETAIGLFPDVGGGYFLPRLPGKLGLYLALTGYRLKGRDVHHAGVATHFIESEKLPQLEEELVGLSAADDNSVGQILDRHHSQCKLDADKPFSLIDHRGDIDRLFGGESVEQILLDLEKEGSEWSLQQLETLKKMSPTSMKITHRQLVKGKTASFSDVFLMEYRMSQGCIRGHDFYEGVRAVLVDKDHTPKWKPDTLKGVTLDMVDEHFKPLPNDLKL
ncbi:3-hydroxyisobutyryl-CoA hydrolase, mitochondrial-like [Amphiura filiformis]|uniref:3-hydroxyisobutyryl-CoA hydrolase, mitochondrial-like n=1 Tax=Amphiura filiformis TaxID=82378 RepID=UPI003B219262